MPEIQQTSVPNFLSNNLLSTILMQRMAKEDVLFQTGILDPGVLRHVCAWIDHLKNLGVFQNPPGNYTPQNYQFAAENGGPLEDEIPIGNHPFSGAMFARFWVDNLPFHKVGYVIVPWSVWWKWGFQLEHAKWKFWPSTGGRESLVYWIFGSPSSSNQSQKGSISQVICPLKVTHFFTKNTIIKQENPLTEELCNKFFARHSNHCTKGIQKILLKVNMLKKKQLSSSTLPETNSSHLKIGHPKRKSIFQPCLFRCPPVLR